MNTAERLPVFLALALEWMAVAGALRSRGEPESDPALSVWREAAWCHLLFARGRQDYAVARLRVVVRIVTGVMPGAVPPPNGADAETAAAALFGHLRYAVEARHPAAFGRQAA